MRRLLGCVIVIMTIGSDVIAAEVGMPQLDPTYWASQAFWLILVFSLLYFSISKFYLPKIKKNIDDRENKIKEDLDEANRIKNLSEQKLKEYQQILENSKREVTKILLDSKLKLDKEIQNIKEKIEKEIDSEVSKVQKEILIQKKDSINSINIISQDIASNIIEKLSGDKLNESSVKAVVEDISKKNIEKYL